ncbi:hypothetical protein EDF56_12011 [Novosphingobium sp. PhB165]|nr:hypothetical protein EDF56_12011 [Novosphingobium sp. PhB165]
MPSPRTDRLRDFTNVALLLAVALGAFAIIPFYVMDDLGRGRIASYSAFCVFLIAYATYEMRDKAWYFPTMVGILGIHLLIIFALPKYIIGGFLVGLFPLAAIDVFGMIYFLNKFDKT